jgi:hypothetical protein
MSAATEPQHLRALARANAIRLQRAALMRRLAATGSQGEGLPAAADVVLEPAAWPPA